MFLTAFDVRAVPKGVRRAGLVVASGTLLGLSYPPFPFAPLAWIALVPLLILWREHDSARAAYVDACGTFLVAFSIAFQWPLFHVERATALLSLPGMLVIPLWMAVPFGLAGACRRRIGATSSVVLLAALYVLMEWGLRRGPFAFPWSLLGHTQAELIPIARLARFGGVPLLTAYVLVLNLLVAALTLRLRGLRLPVAGLAVAGFLASLPPSQIEETGDVLHVGLVQPAVPAEEWAEIHDARRVRLLLALSDTLAAGAAAESFRADSISSDASGPDLRAGADGLDLVVWPETALPPGDDRSRRLVQEWIDARRVPLITGAIEMVRAREAFYNAALYLRPEETGGVYRKRRLVPFAEYVPFQDRWPWVRRLAVPSGGVAGYARGRTREPMEIRRARFGVLICFETLFDDLTRDYARRGANLLVAITQDGWWGNSLGYRQHLAFNRLRVIETGLPLVQASVSGVSAVIQADGAIQRRIGWMDRTAFAAAVRPAKGSTLFVRWGDWVSPLALAAVCIATLGPYLRRRT